MTWEKIVVTAVHNEEELEREQREERIPRMKTGERYEMEHKKEGQQRQIMVVSRAGSGGQLQYSRSRNSTYRLGEHEGVYQL